MVIQLISSLLTTTWNNARRTHLQKKEGQLLPAEPTPAGHVVLGEVIPHKSDMAAAGVRENLLPKIVTVSVKDRLMPMYVLGGTGTGKTTTLLHLVEADIVAQCAFATLDARGDFIDRIILRVADATQNETLEKIGNRVLLIDLREHEYIVGFNPLVGDGDFYSRAYHILSVIKKQSESFGVQLEETLRNALLALAETEWTLLEIEPLLTNANFRSQVLERVSDSCVKTFFARYNELSAEKQTSWCLPVLNKVSPLLAIPQMRLMFGQRQSLSLRRLLDQQPGQIILISLAVDQLHEAAYLAGGLLVASLQNALMSRVDIPERQRVPVHLYLDEFENLASDRFEQLIAEGRRFGVGLCLSHQTSSQLSPRLRDILRNNVHTSLYFQTGGTQAPDIARDIVTTLSKEEVCHQLLMQQVGEAFVVRRGKESCRVRIPDSPDPSIAPETITALRAASFKHFARPRVEVEQELTAREEYLAALGRTSAPTPRRSQSDSYNDSQSKDTTTSSISATSFEVRHGKQTTFRPSPIHTDANHADTTPHNDSAKPTTDDTPVNPKTNPDPTATTQDAEPLQASAERRTGLRPPRSQAAD